MCVCVCVFVTCTKAALFTTVVHPQGMRRGREREKALTLPHCLERRESSRVALARDLEASPMLRLQAWSVAKHPHCINLWGGSARSQSVAAALKGGQVQCGAAAARAGACTARLVLQRCRPQPLGLDLALQVCTATHKRNNAPHCHNTVGCGAAGQTRGAVLPATERAQACPHGLRPSGTRGALASTCEAYIAAHKRDTSIHAAMTWPAAVLQDGRVQCGAAAARAGARPAGSARVRRCRRRRRCGAGSWGCAARLGRGRLPAALRRSVLQPGAAAAVHHRDRVQPGRRAARVHAVRLPRQRLQLLSYKILLSESPACAAPVVSTEAHGGQTLKYSRRARDVT